MPPLAQQQIIEDPTPAVEDDVEAVKTLCGMGFSRTQAVTALEEHGYDVQRALNSLLGPFTVRACVEHNADKDDAGTQ